MRTRSLAIVAAMLGLLVTGCCNKDVQKTKSGQTYTCASCPKCKRQLDRTRINNSDLTPEQRFYRADRPSGSELRAHSTDTKGMVTRGRINKAYPL